MEIQVDGNRQEMQPLPPTMGRLINDLKGAVANAGKVVLSVSVDGAVMDARHEREISDEPVGNFTSVSVETAEPKALCLVTLEEVKRHIQPLIDECNRIGDLIDTGKSETAFQRIVPCLEVWGAILGAVQKIAALMKISIHEITTEEEALSDAVKGLVDFLEALKSRIDAHDVVSVRDAMKHEMPELAERISKQLEALSSAIIPA